MKLFCFPHAGGFSLYYAFLRKYEYQHIEKIFVFDYPRNNFTFNGTPSDFQQYVDAATDYIQANKGENEPFMLFGHSMGAYIACEAGLAMQNKYGKAPLGVIVSGQNPPYSVTLGKHQEMPTDLYAFAKRLGGVPQKILENKQMCEKLYKFAEADMKAVATYKPTQVSGDERLSCGMLLHGTDDFIVDPAYYGHWDKTFCKIFMDKVFTGDHFYFNNHRDEIAPLLDNFAEVLSKETK